MRAKLFYMIMCVSLLFTSCNEESTGNIFELNAPQECDFELKTDSVRVNNQEIDNVVKSILPKARSGNGNYTLNTITDKENNPLYYIVNYENNGGFVLISATKNFHPVLAYNTTGYFNINGNMPDGLLLWKGQTEELISKSKDFTPNEKEKFRNLWKKYENRENTTTFTPESRSGDRPDWYYDAQTIVMNKRLELASQGYEVYSYSDDFTSDNSFNEEVRDFIRGYIYPEYEDYYEDLSIIVLNPFHVEIENTPNFVLTTWNQDNGYNSAYPILSNDSIASVGCVPLAIGQIMRHYQYPARFNWSNMPLNSPNSTISSFLLDVTERCNGSYTIYGTSAYLTDGEDALNFYGYNANIGEHSPGRVYANIKARKPVIMSGDNITKGTGHAWIASGANFKRTKETIEVWTFNTSTDFRCCYTSERNHLDEFHFYMNWGWGGYYNAFYNDNNLYISGNGYRYIQTDNIYDISPNN